MVNCFIPVMKVVAEVVGTEVAAAATEVVAEAVVAAMVETVVVVDMGVVATEVGKFSFQKYFDFTLLDVNLSQGGGGGYGGGGY